ncbi:MAG: hypothetical protein K0S43_784 [Cellulosimicrobium sp.]|nr:hypothetical protein [Cellulosimicrobium sp.]
MSEAGGGTTRGAFRHNYSWKGFWTHTVALDLTTDDGALTLGNATGWAPNLDTLALAPLVLDVTNSGSSAGVALDVQVQPRCLAGKAYLAVRATNQEQSAVDITVVTAYGTREFAAVAPERSGYQSFATRAARLDAGTVTVAGATDGRDGQYDVAYDALDCD